MSEDLNTRYRAAVIGLGWTGLLYDLAERSGERFDVDDVDRPTPFRTDTEPGGDLYPSTYSESLWNRAEAALVPNQA